MMMISHLQMPCALLDKRAVLLNDATRLIGVHTPQHAAVDGLETRRGTHLALVRLVQPQRVSRRGACLRSTATCAKLEERDAV